MSTTSDQHKLDIDVRFLLANERTLLAWIRTSLTIEAGGLALATVHRHHAGIGIAVLLVGAVMALVGYQRFRAAERAIRNGSLPSTGIGPALQVYAVVLVAILLAVAQLTVLK